MKKDNLTINLNLKLNLNLRPHFQPKNLNPDAQLVQNLGPPKHVRHDELHWTHWYPPPTEIAFAPLVYPAAHVLQAVAERQVLHWAGHVSQVPASPKK